MRLSEWPDGGDLKNKDVQKIIQDFATEVVLFFILDMKAYSDAVR